MFEELGGVLMLRGRYDEAGEQLEAAARFAKGSFAKAKIGNKLGELAFKRGDMEGAIEYFERGPARAGQVGAAQSRRAVVDGAQGGSEPGVAYGIPDMVRASQATTAAR